MFEYLIIVKPLGFLYGSAGAFLSAENLVGLSGAKFPPDASALSGLILRTYQENVSADQEEIKHLKQNLTVAGAFWAKDEDLVSDQNFYVPIPRSRTIGEDDCADWKIVNGKWDREDKELKADYSWQRINYWNDSIELVQAQGVAKNPWKFTPILHPSLQDEQRHVLQEDGLFLENAVHMDEDSCLVYLSTHKLDDGWYRFGGENHMVEISSQKLKPEILELLNTPIERSFALICPAVWGTNNLSERYPSAFKASHKPPKMLTDRPVPFRYRMGGKLGIGRYAVPAGTVYVLKHDLDEQYNTWWKFPYKWFPQSNKAKDFDKRSLPLKHLGCGLCLPIKIEGVD